MTWSRRAVLGGFAATILHVKDAAAAPAKTPDGFLVLEAAPGTLRLLPTPAPQTAVWAYDGIVPGPLIRVKKGDEIKVRLVNKLAQPTSLTWHGMRVPNAMDGVAGLTQKPVQPGESFDYRFTPPDAGFYWYHPHVFPQGADQIARGLYGLVIVDEPQAPQIDQDLMVVIDDWAIDAKAQIATDVHSAPTAPPATALVTVNSRPLPADPVQLRPGTRLRLRLVNVCARRIAIVAFAGMEPLVIAIDGQASELFPPAGGLLPIGPGARFEVIADLPREPGRTATIALRGDRVPDLTLMTFLTKGETIPARPRVTALPANPSLPTRIPLETSLKIDLVLGGSPETRKPIVSGPSAHNWQWTINGTGSDGFSGKPLFRVRRGGSVTLAFVNKTTSAQQMHIHGHVFRILHDLDDGWDPYWRESILIAPGRTKHVAFVADNPGKWAVESLFPDRQVAGLAAWFEVI